SVPATVTIPATGQSVALTATGHGVAGQVTITASLPPSLKGGAMTAAVSVTNPTPALASLTPAIATAGGPAFALTAAGGVFVPPSVARGAGAPLATTFVSATRLTAQVPAANLAAGATVDITVFNPGPGGGPSNAVPFTAANPVPTLASLSP